MPMNGMTFALIAGSMATLSGCVALQRDVDIKNEAFEKEIQAEHADNAKLRADLDATRERLDNALRANADTGSDVMNSKARLNELAGRTDELSHTIEDVKKDVGSTRTELESRIDDLKRTQLAIQNPPPPPVVIPEGKAPHFAALEAAYAKKDFGLVRTLGHEYTSRYPSGDNTDDAYFLIGDGDLQDGPSFVCARRIQSIAQAFPAFEEARHHPLRHGGGVLAASRLREREACVSRPASRAIRRRKPGSTPSTNSPRSNIPRRGCAPRRESGRSRRKLARTCR